MMPRKRKREAVPDMDVLRWIAAFYNGRGYMPKMREICIGMGFRSTNSPRTHIAAFRARGWLTHEPGQSRTLRITPLGQEALRDAS